MSTEEQPDPRPVEDLAPAAEPSAAAPRPRKRVLLWALVGLYAAALAAALVIVLRPAKDNGGRGGGLDKAASLLASKKEAVGWVSVRGGIYQGEASSHPWGKGSPSLVRRLRSLADKKEVKAIVLDINSPGGSVGAVQEIHSQIKRIREEKKKPIVALMGDVAASGGYYIAAPCNLIVAHPGTLIGSIGVAMHLSNIEGLFSKIGVKSEILKSGKMKDIGSMTRPMTKEERELLQSLIDDSYGQFLAAVSEGRGIPVEQVKPLADGRIFTGAQALEKKLVDELGDSTRALELAAKLGGITGKPEILRDADSWAGFLEFLDSAYGGRLTGELDLVRELKSQWSYSGLEYRWGR
ncbi:MAG TPA: signal peptide peptidase SppA [Elusimicrobia bacterium]|nr:signal peptide peptidase SppA [Elusimicrobiota bacterium]